MVVLLKKPNAWIPVALSLILVLVWIVSFATSGPPARQADEGTGAHLFQIWLVLEVLLIAFFALRWLPQKPAQALVVLVLQIIAVLLACAPVAYFHL